MAVVGYARVSTRDQDLDLQLQALQAAGCEVEHTYQEKQSGAKKARPELTRMLDFVRKGDVVVVYRLDRLARSMAHLIALMEVFKSKGVGLRVLTGVPIDTTSPGGELVFHIFAAISQFERAQIRERTQAGVAKARADGIKFGRPRLDEAKVADIRRRFLAGESWRRISRETGVAAATIGRYLDELEKSDKAVKAKRDGKPSNGRRREREHTDR